MREAEKREGEARKNKGKGGGWRWRALRGEKVRRERREAEKVRSRFVRESARRGRRKIIIN